MNKSDPINSLADGKELSKAKTTQRIDVLFRRTTDVVSNGHCIEIRRLFRMLIEKSESN